MAAGENWQTKLSTIAEKTAFIFNKELLSDVKFVVPMSTVEVKSLIKGLTSWYGEDGQTPVECQGVHLRFVVRRIALMGPMKEADSFLEFCFQYPSRNSNVTRTVSINVEPCESLLGQVVMD